MSVSTQYTTHITCPECDRQYVAKSDEYVWCIVARCGWGRPIDSTHLTAETNERN